jgi:spore germination protein KB
MQKNMQITREQFVGFTFIGIIGNVVYIHTSIDVLVDRAAWLACLLGILLLFPFVLWILYLAKTFPGDTLFDILEKGVGKFLCFLISIVYILINISIAATHLNMFTQMLNVFFLPNTPMYIIILFLILIAVLIVKSELTTIARLVELLVVLALIFYVSCFLLSFKELHFKYIYPIFDTSFLEFIKGCIFITGATSEYLLLLMVLVGFIPAIHTHYKWAIVGIYSSAVIFSLAILVIIAMLSPELAARIAFGGVNAAKLIHIGRFIQGLELFVYITYQFIAIGKVCLCLYCACTSAKKILNFKKERVLIFMIAMLIFISSIWLNSYNKAYFLAAVLSCIILPFSIVALILASVSSLIIKNKKTRSA